MDRKEREPLVKSDGEQISLNQENLTGQKERSLEVESVIEKLERQAKVDNRQQDANDDVSGGTVVPASDDQPAVTLPVTQDEVVQGQKMPVWMSFRWLAEWAMRQIKKFSGRVRYRGEQNERN